LRYVSFFDIIHSARQTPTLAALRESALRYFNIVLLSQGCHNNFDLEVLLPVFFY
jgi:hypothetical protein